MANKEETIPDILMKNSQHQLLNRNQSRNFYVIRHFFKCALMALIILILLEKVSRKYKILNASTSYEEESIDFHQTKLEQKQNTFHCDQKLEIANATKMDAVLLLRDDIINLKQMVVKLNEQIRERRRFECIAKKELSKIEDRVKKVLSESDMVDRKIKEAIHVYETDKMALFDYAASYAGGKVISTSSPKNEKYNFFNFFKWNKESSPQQILVPSSFPGDCFTFLGNTSKIVIQLGKPIVIGSVSLEHSFSVKDITSAPKNFRVYALKDITSAPKNFRVYALKDSTENSKKLIGNFIYEVKNKQNFQTFEIKPKLKEKFEYVMLEILDNHGNDEHTSIYRFRVHS